MADSWIDISAPLRAGVPVWPGDPPFARSTIMDVARGDACTLSAIEMCAHTGTHIDAPAHYLADGATIDALSFEAVNGAARVIEFDALDPPGAITVDVLRDAGIGAGERVLFKTRNSARAWEREPFDGRFVSIAHDAAQYLVECGVRLVGIDYLSVGAFEGDGVETHQALLGAGVWLLEGLILRDVPAGEVELRCLSLRIVGAEAAPARAFVRPAVGAEEKSTV